MEQDRGETVGLRSLRRLAAAIGSDPQLVQGAGGNVSLKSGEIMWIKASGTWLAEAESRDIMVPVTLASCASDRPVVPDWDGSGLRPSIETSMHAALPQAVVLHVHSVDAIALAVRADAMETLGHRLAGLRWAFVPYARPGLPLTHAVGEAVREGAVDILILGNHGLVVAAPDVAAAEALLNEVVGRLSVEPRDAAPTPAILPAVEGTGYRLPADPAVHALATDPASRAIAQGGVLYPDHVVFLGSAPLAIEDGEDLAAALAALAVAGQAKPKWVIVRGKGVALADDAMRGSEEMLRCLADVAARIPPGASLCFLGDADIAALTDWDAEKYRQRLARAVA